MNNSMYEGTFWPAHKNYNSTQQFRSHKNLELVFFGSFQKNVFKICLSDYLSYQNQFRIWKNKLCCEQPQLLPAKYRQCPECPTIRTNGHFDILRNRESLSQILYCTLMTKCQKIDEYFYKLFHNDFIPLEFSFTMNFSKRKVKKSQFRVFGSFEPLCIKYEQTTCINKFR